MYDAIVIGSGFGGAMSTYRLVEAGWRVLLLERGSRVRRGPHNREPHATLELTPHYSRESAYKVVRGGYGDDAGSVFCLGGPSVFYGGVSFRFREADFIANPEIVRDSGARWPFGYSTLEPYYDEAERLLSVAGDDSDDPTRPPRRHPYPQAPAPLAQVSEQVRDAARSLGLSPFPLPLAINHDSSNGRKACDVCRTCDTYACAIEAKNDLAVSLVEPLERENRLEVRADMVVNRLEWSNGRITAVRAWDKAANREASFRGRYVVLAAGALASPHLLLASDLARANPAGHAIGGYLARHCCAMVFGFCNFRPDPEKVFHKQLAVLDYYFGDSASRKFRAKHIGSIQQITTPPAALMGAHMGTFGERVPLGGFVEHLISTLVIAEDEPRPDNRVTLDVSDKDPFGLPRLVVSHGYSAGDKTRRRMLVRRAKRILRRVGAWSFYTHNIKTFSHAFGTVRMGEDSTGSPLDPDSRFRGIENLLVVDGSALPTGGAVNPSLTIAANALRAVDRLVSEGAK